MNIEHQRQFKQLLVFGTWFYEHPYCTCTDSDDLVSLSSDNDETKCHLINCEM